MKYEGDSGDDDLSIDGSRGRVIGVSNTLSWMLWGSGWSGVSVSSGGGSGIRAV